MFAVPISVKDSYILYIFNRESQHLFVFDRNGRIAKGRDRIDPITFVEIFELELKG